MVSCHCVLCHNHNETVLEQPTLLWFGEESHAPLVCMFPKVVVEKGLVQLNGDRKVWCKGQAVGLDVDDIGL